MIWLRNRTNVMCLAVVAGLAVGSFGASHASAGFYGPDWPNEEGTSIDDPSILKNPFPDEIDIWEDADPDGSDNPIGHIDIPEIDKDGKPKAPAPTTLLLPPPPGTDTGDPIFDIGQDPSLDWLLGSQQSAPQLDGHHLPGGTVIVSSTAFNGVPAPGTIGLMGLGLLVINKRRRG